MLIKVVTLIVIFLLQSSSDEAQEGPALRAGRGVLQNRTQASAAVSTSLQTRPALSRERAGSGRGLGQAGNRARPQLPAVGGVNGMERDPRDESMQILVGSEETEPHSG